MEEKLQLSVSLFNCR